MTLLTNTFIASNDKTADSKVKKPLLLPLSSQKGECPPKLRKNGYVWKARLFPVCSLFRITLFVSIKLRWKKNSHKTQDSIFLCGGRTWMVTKLAVCVKSVCTYYIACMWSFGRQQFSPCFLDLATRPNLSQHYSPTNPIIDKLYMSLRRDDRHISRLLNCEMLGRVVPIDTVLLRWIICDQQFCWLRLFLFLFFFSFLSFFLSLPPYISFPFGNIFFSLFPFSSFFLTD